MYSLNTLINELWKITLQIILNKHGQAEPKGYELGVDFSVGLRFCSVSYLPSA
jgi:hypothetical protein